MKSGMRGTVCVRCGGRVVPGETFIAETTGGETLYPLCRPCFGLVGGRIPGRSEARMLGWSLLVLFLLALAAVWEWWPR